MEFFLRTLAIYLFLLVLFRLTGKRTLSELSTFDFILLLIISEATQNALIDDDKSLVAGLAVVLTLVLLDLAMSYLKKRFGVIEKITEGVPVVLVDRGKVIQEHLDKTRVTVSDILQTARLTHGLERMEQIKYAVLETSGGISIIPAGPDLDAILDHKVDAALNRRLKERGSDHG
jgi:uncharacterized membrane protein YcaP (DUF421 family)